MGLMLLKYSPFPQLWMGMVLSCALFMFWASCDGPQRKRCMEWTDDLRRECARWQTEN